VSQEFEAKLVSQAQLVNKANVVLLVRKETLGHPVSVVFQARMARMV
jgi:hypothetical protein